MRPQLGLDLAADHHPDLVLLDLHLPDMPGEAVLRRLQTSPGTAGIPVAILSADARPGLIQRLLDQGARAFLTKPLDVRELLELLDAVATDREQAGRPDGSGRAHPAGGRARRLADGPGAAAAGARRLTRRAGRRTSQATARATTTAAATAMPTCPVSRSTWRQPAPAA
jgi:DNA-binding response OmpR family regulator